MEQTNQNSIFSDLEFDHIGKQHIRTIGQWAVVIAVIGLVTNVVGLIQGLAVSVPEMSMSQGSIYSLTGSALFATKFFVVLSAAISITLNVFLYLFGSKSKTGIDNQDGNAIGRSFGNLKAYFMIQGIIVVIFAVIVLLAALLGGLGAAMK